MTQQEQPVAPTTAEISPPIDGLCSARAAVCGLPGCRQRRQFSLGVDEPFFAVRKDLSHTRRNRRKPVVGLVGSVGAGKSTVAHLLARLGCGVIDADQLVHEQYLDPDVTAQLREWWGERVFSSDGSIDRAIVADIVFNDPAELRRLEGFLYPRLHERRKELIQQFMTSDDVACIVLDAPKLYEAGLQDECDAVICVDAHPDLRARRVGKSRSWSVEDLLRRERQQLSTDEKRSRADFLIENNSTTGALAREVERVFAAILQR